MEAVEVSTVMEDLLPVPAPGLPPDRFLTGSCPGSPSTTESSIWPKTPSGCRCWNVRSSSRSSPPTWTSFIWSASPG